MAEKQPASDIISDMTRESLIAIAYSLPDKINDAASPDLSEKTTDAGNTLKKKTIGGIKAGSGIEDFRSELISISYTSPEDEPQPEVKG